MKRATIVITVFTMLFFMNSGVAQAQEQHDSPNTIYIELAGHGLLYSINYDRLLSSLVSVKIGFSAINDESSVGVARKLRTVPIAINYILGKTPLRLELGTGVEFISFYLDDVSWRLNDKWGIAVIHSIMLRIQPEEGGVNFRAGLTPAWGRRFFLYGGVSIGWTF